MLSLLVLVLMSASIDCQSSPSICDFLLKDGRVRDIGIYQYLIQGHPEKGTLEIWHNYLLFHRGTSVVEYLIEIKDRNVSANPKPLDRPAFGLHKFFAGPEKAMVNDTAEQQVNIYHNCRVHQKVCIL